MGNDSIVKQLLDKNADINIKSNVGKTALIWGKLKFNSFNFNSKTIIILFSLPLWS
jgi:ankyrin repeat protein